MLGSFNPRPCMRGDEGEREGEERRESFNPRPCMRGDNDGSGDWHQVCRFNPRPCMRGDEWGQRGLSDHTVSIHAPA